MKLMIRNTIILLALVLGFTACSLDEDPKMNVTATPELNAPETTTYVLDKNTESLTVQTFSWTKGNFGFATGGKYELQAYNNSEFTGDMVSLGTAYNVFLPVTVKTMNQCALKWAVESGKDDDGNITYDPVDIYLRVVCHLNDVKGDNKVEVASTDPLRISVTPYDASVEYPKIYVVGTPNGWDINGNSVFVEDFMGDGVYTGTLDLKEGSNMFRFYTALGDWDNNSLGSQVDDSSVNITEEFIGGTYTTTYVEGKGSWEIVLTEAAPYKITLNTNAKTLEIKLDDGSESDILPPSQWKFIYVIGTVQGWDINSDKVKAVDKRGNNVYEVTLTLDKASNMFRFYTALGDWENNSLGAAVEDSNVSITDQFINGTYSGPVVAGNGNWEIGVMGTMNVAIDLNTMAVSYQFVGKPEEPDVETGLFLVGNINGWDIESDAAALVKDGDTYQGTFEFPADAGEPEYSFFRLYTQLGNWGAGSIGAGGEANVDVIFDEGIAILPLTEGSQTCFKLKPGAHTVFVSADLSMITITEN